MEANRIEKLYKTLDNLSSSEVPTEKDNQVMKSIMVKINNIANEPNKSESRF